VTNILRTIIVDDEPLARRGLNIRLSEHKEIEIVAECVNGREALTAIEEYAPDLMFLDIQMPGMDGFDVIHAMQADDAPLVVFVTAFDQYAIDAFKVHAVDYILKPIDDERLSEALDRVQQKASERNALSDKQTLLTVIGDITGNKPSNLEDAIAASEEAKQQYSETIAIKDAGNVTIIKTKEVDWIDAAGDYMCLHVGGTIHVMRTTMKKLDALLDPKIFQRVHRSTIVNINRIRQVCSHINGEHHLLLDNGSRLKMSRSYKTHIKALVNV